MSYKCYGKVKTGKKKGERCNNNINDEETNEREKLVDGKTYYFCKKHINVNSIEDVVTDGIEESKEKTIGQEINVKDNIQTIINEFNTKVIIDNEIKTDNNNFKNNESKQKNPCLQHIIYLISNDKNDICQFEDCQFAHNIDIVYT